LLLPQALKGAWVCSTKRGMEPKIYDLKEVEVDERKKKKKKKRSHGFTKLWGWIV